MSNPFTYLELHSTDANGVKTFYAELFGSLPSYDLSQT